MNRSLRIPILLLAISLSTASPAIDLGTALLYNQYLNNQRQQQQNNSSSSNSSSQSAQAAPTAAPAPTIDPGVAAVAAAGQSLVQSISNISQSTQSNDAAVLALLSPSSKKDDSGSGSSDGSDARGGSLANQTVSSALLKQIAKETQNIQKDDPTINDNFNKTYAALVSNGDANVSGQLQEAAIVGQMALKQAAQAADDKAADAANAPAADVGGAIQQFGNKAAAAKTASAKKGFGYGLPSKDAPIKPPSFVSSSGSGHSGHAAH